MKRRPGGSDEICWFYQKVRHKESRLKIKIKRIERVRKEVGLGYLDLQENAIILCNILRR